MCSFHCLHCKYTNLMLSISFHVFLLFLEPSRAGIQSFRSLCGDQWTLSGYSALQLLCIVLPDAEVYRSRQMGTFICILWQKWKCAQTARTDWIKSQSHFDKWLTCREEFYLHSWVSGHMLWNGHFLSENHACCRAWWLNLFSVTWSNFCVTVYLPNGVVMQ